MSIDETKEFVSHLNAVFQSLSCLHVPTISAVGGAAVGGGLELALATDVRVFSSSANVSLPETRIGIIPGAGGTYRLREIIGEPRALEMILTGRRVWGPLAYSYGLCQRLVKALPGHESRVAVLAESIKRAREICEGAPLAVGAAMRAVKGSTLRVEEREYHSVLLTKDRNRALAAYVHKVAPEFKGD
ncbi:hypothetical protein MMC22_008324 [Lobaria immixta]|nr:hypothetical protein [Lobaria immixta]